MTARLLFVVFSPSIISDIGNPQAATVRAICGALATAGHDVTHLEERGNPHLSELLRQQGYTPMRSFNANYPLIRYRQYDVKGGWERVVWFGREIGTADVVVAYPGVAEAIVHEIAAVESPRIITFWPGVSGAKRALLPLWYEPVESPVDTPTSALEVGVVVDDNANFVVQVEKDAQQRAERLAAAIHGMLVQRTRS